MLKSITANLMVESVDETAAFYRDVLGFTAVDSVPADDGSLQFAILAKEGFTLMFQDRKNLISEYPILKTDKVQPSITLYFITDDLSALYNELKGKCEMLSDIHKTFYGAEEFAISDNNGYVLTFAQQQGE